MRVVNCRLHFRARALSLSTLGAEGLASLDAPFRLLLERVLLVCWALIVFS